MDDLAAENRRLTLECANMYAVQEVGTAEIHLCDDFEGECADQERFLEE